MPGRESVAGGHLQVVGARGNRRWRAFWSDADGKHARMLGPAWVKDSGRRTARGATVWRVADGPKPKGYLTPAEAEGALRELLVAAPRHPSPEVPTFAQAAAEWLRHAEQERGVKPSTLVGYRSIVSSELLPAFGERRLDAITPREIELWRSAEIKRRGLNPRSMNKTTTVIGGIYKRASRAWDVVANPVDRVDKLRERAYDDLNFFEPAEIWALVRAADSFDPSGQDGALLLALSFAGLRRGEALALSWRDVDFEREAIRVRGNWSYGRLVTTKGGRIRSVPLVPQLALRLALLGQRKRWTDIDDPVFVNEIGRRLDGSALRRRYVRARDQADLRPLRLHDLRHAFASLAIDHASPVEVQAWAGHQDARTTARYTHYKSRHDEAKRLAKAFEGGDRVTQAPSDPSRV